jgi:hypothetical protein
MVLFTTEVHVLQIPYLQFIILLTFLLYEIVESFNQGTEQTIRNPCAYYSSL